MTIPKPIPLGPVMVDLAGPTLTEHERQRLLHPQTGAVILFTRNFASLEQLIKLTTEIHELRNPPLLIAIDHEGGRVQRFQQGFTRIPPMRALGTLWDEHPQKAKHVAQQLGYILAAELRAHGIDFSFTPVLDIDYGNSTIIGDRAFHRDPQAITELSKQLIIGLKQAGMASVGKHFPGHGYIAADSHLELPIDHREYNEIAESDLVPFQHLIESGLTAIMPAHVVYPNVDKEPAGFSGVWLKTILRERLGFDGVIFSDDLSMEGAAIAGNITQRAQAAVDAGCDMVLVCNSPDAADELLETFKWEIPAVSLARLARMHGRPHADSIIKLREQPAYVKALHEIGGIGQQNEALPLDSTESRLSVSS